MLYLKNTVSCIVFGQALFNHVGQIVRELIDEEMQPGYHKIIWDAKDNYGESVSTGIYICQMVAGDYKKAIKLLFIK